MNKNTAPARCGRTGCVSYAPHNPSGLYGRFPEKHARSLKNGRSLLYGFFPPMSCSPKTAPKPRTPLPFCPNRCYNYYSFPITRLSFIYHLFPCINSLHDV